MKELVAKTGRECQETEAEAKEMEEPRLVRWKLTAGAQREREELIVLGVYGSDEENDIIENTMSVDKEYSNHTIGSRFRVDTCLPSRTEWTSKKSIACFSPGSTSANQLPTGFLPSPNLL